MFYLLTRLFELLLNLGLEPGSDHLCSLTLSFYLAESSYFGKDFFFIDQIILLLFVTFQLLHHGLPQLIGGGFGPFRLYLGVEIWLNEEAPADSRKKTVL